MVFRLNELNNHLNYVIMICTFENLKEGCTRNIFLMVAVQHLSECHPGCQGQVVSGKGGGNPLLITFLQSRSWIYFWLLLFDLKYIIYVIKCIFSKLSPITRWLKMTKDCFMKARYLNLFGTRNMCTVVPKVDWG